jgi:hypothetical protein
MDCAAGPTPPLYMHLSRRVLSDKDINCIANYLRSKQQQKKESWQPTLAVIRVRPLRPT